MKEAVVYLGLGTNLEPRQKNLRRSLERIDEDAGRLVALSTIYQSTPFGFQSEHGFLNAVCAIHTALSPYHLLKELQRIEWELGRRRKMETMDRPIDIDILLYGTRKYSISELQIPHPGLNRRDFVWVPLREINPGIAQNSLIGQPDLVNTELLKWKDGTAIWP